MLLRLRACALHFLRHLAEQEAELDVPLELPCVEAVALPVCRGVELEEPELDCGLREGRMVVEHMVPAVVVVGAAVVARAVACVPDVRELRHGLRLLFVELLQEARVNRAAVAAHPAPVKVECFRDQALMARHDVGEVSQALRRVAFCPDVDVYPAAPPRVALRAGVPELPDKFLQGFNVRVGEDRRHQLAFFAVRPRDADVPLEFPFPAVGVPGAPGAVAVPTCCVFVPPCSEKVCRGLRRSAPRDAVHLYLHPDGLFLCFRYLPCYFFVHPFYLRFVCFPFR